MARSAFTTLDMGLGFGFSQTLIFHGQGGEQLKASMVKSKDAKRIKELLTGN